MTVYYMSFVQSDRPKGERFVGACLVHANSFEEAIKTAWKRGCNPGGEIQGGIPEFIPDEKWFYRILSLVDLAEMEVELNQKYHKDSPRHTPRLYQ